MKTIDQIVGDRIAAALRSAPPLNLPRDLIESCIDSGHESAQSAEAQFRTAFEQSLWALPPGERLGRLNGVTGHIAESVAERLLVDAGWTPVEHFTGPFSGGHGIDLAMLAPDQEHLFVVEVKGTLQPMAETYTRRDRSDVPGMVVSARQSGDAKHGRRGR